MVSVVRGSKKGGSQTTTPGVGGVGGVKIGGVNLVRGGHVGGEKLVCSCEGWVGGRKIALLATPGKTDSKKDSP